MKQQDNDCLLLAKLHEWDPDWGEKYRRMSTNPWSNGVLPVKLIELICLALNSACTNLQPEATRRHIRAALAAGATREEILFVLKCSSLLSIRSTGRVTVSSSIATAAHSIKRWIARLGDPIPVTFRSFPFEFLGENRYGHIAGLSPPNHAEF